ncbi:MAG: hypothetical protein GY696_23440 [Gammaproteobacteria bacterium]|nr:hypothetical protein [Gammaproteobacteria bacterium]
MVSPLRRQICLNPVWRVGSGGSRSEPEQPEAERSEAAGPEPTTQNYERNRTLFVFWTCATKV